MDKYLDAWQKMRSITRDFFATPNLCKAFIYGFTLYALALFALLRGDIYYMDDLYRAFSDYGGNYHNRYLTEFILQNALSFGKGTMDLSPLPQILGVCLMVISTMILIYLIRGKFDLLGIIASLPLGLSPHFLQNLSYKFDALTMSMALFFAILPFLFKENRRGFIAISIVSLLCMFMCYQAANGIYIILSLYFALFGRNIKQSAEFLGICVLNLIVASLIYKITLDSTSADKLIALDSFMGLWANLAKYATTIFNDLRHTAYMWLILLNGVLFIINATIYANRNKMMFSAIAFLTLGFVLSFGLYMVLQEPNFEPRAFYGFNAFVAIITIANVSSLNNDSQDLRKIRQILHYFSCILAIITAYFLISFANIYGNAIKKQDEYLDFRTQLLLQDLSDKIPKGATTTIFTHNIGNSPVTERFYQKYGALLLIPHLAKQDDFWFDIKLRHLNVPYNLGNGEICNFIKEIFGSEVIFKNANHTIERAKSCYMVMLR